MGEATASALGSPEIGEIQIFRTYAEELLARSVTAWLCTEEEPRVEVYWCGEDEKHGGRGSDHIVGNLRSEHHFGGRGDDLLVDADSRKNPDVFRCGPGVDRVHYNKGLDKVANDCEDLRPYNRY